MIFKIPANNNIKENIETIQLLFTDASFNPTVFSWNRCVTFEHGTNRPLEMKFKDYLNKLYI